MNEVSVLSVVGKAIADYAGVILGGLTALGGVMLTNRAHAQRLKEQFAHEREVKNREREMSLRKEVYLDAIEAVTARFIAIGHFSDLEIKDDKILEEYRRKAPSLAKISIIAKAETVGAISNLAGELEATFLRLTAKRFPLLFQSQEIVGCRALVDGFLKEQTRALELMKQHNLDGPRDQQKLKVLQDQFDFESRRIEETLKKADDLAALLLRKQLKFMEESFEESMRLSRLMVPVIVLVRKELELPIDESAYSKISEEQVAKLASAVNEFKLQVHSLIPPTSQP